MDSLEKEPPNGLEWRVPMPEGAPATTRLHVAGPALPAPLGAWTLLMMLKTKGFGFADRVWKMGAEDPRKAMYGFKLGVALTLVSLLYYVRPMYDGVGGNAVWAIMTVVLAFEYTVGGTVSKGINGTAGTMSAALLALGVHWVATKSGHRFEPVVASGSVFVLGAAAAFARFIPTVALRFDYGVTAFILTYGYVSVSGYRVHELPVLALQRICSYSIGILICVAVSVLICPVWSGEQLRLLTARNMESLAAACVLDSKAAEDAHANLAWWEPAHGRFGFRHPYAQYAHVGAAMRRCACCLDVLGSCVGGESQSAERVLGEACTRLGEQSARVLREAAGCIATMTVRRSLGLAVEDLDAAVHELRAGLSAVETEALPPLFTVASSLLLIDVSARVKEVVDAVHVLATLARFKPADDEGGDKAPSGTKVHPLRNASQGCLDMTP
ncbi:hypothetical protein PR202_gb09341 [Eleusine coracana subsp. coracana]|uniref:Aluminum-activated malate transporter 10 n=1 Tax=Eleusine coracana subsp. coracana TaxID=191504 RepID=A0AAV5EHB0_ELECO|nr:hypothetical protein PR202_gb09341 [Eleusine coracana subsp. coracana]